MYQWINCGNCYEITHDGQTFFMGPQEAQVFLVGLVEEGQLLQEIYLVFWHGEELRMPRERARNFLVSMEALGYDLRYYGPGLWHLLVAGHH